MTGLARGRSLHEVILVVGLGCFLAGFVAVLCVGNYYRAKRAMERQKHRRLARLAGNAGNGVVGLESPRSDHSSASSYAAEERQQLLMGNRGHGQNVTRNEQTARRRNMEEATESLLLDIHDEPPRAQIAAV